MLVVGIGEVTNYNAGSSYQNVVFGVGVQEDAVDYLAAKAYRVV